MVLHIMVVDDEPDVAELFRRRFRREIKSGTHVFQFASSGDEVLELLATGLEPQVMLILSDINMPGMTGLELLQRVKELYPALPVAMITAYGDQENEQSAFESGAADFLNKPLDFAALKDRLPQLAAAERNGE